MFGRLFGKGDPSAAHDKGVARDAAMLAIFRQHGTDMDRTRPTDHNFLVGSEAAARALSDRLAEHSDKVTVTRVLRRWTVEAVVLMPLTDASVAEHRAVFEALAIESDATYDGWGAAADGPA